MKWVNYLILVFLCLFGSIWVFNHINSWLGILLGFVGLYFVVYKFINYV